MLVIVEYSSIHCDNCFMRWQLNSLHGYNLFEIQNKQNTSHIGTESINFTYQNLDLIYILWAEHICIFINLCAVYKTLDTIYCLCGVYNLYSVCQ